MKLNKQRQPALSREAHLSLSPFSLLRSPKRANTQVRPYCLLLLLTATLPAFAQDLTVCAGKGYTLTSNVDATGASEVTYEWYESVNGAASSTIPNSNTPSISFPGGKATAGTYAYVRKAANTECPAGVFSNLYTVVVAAPAAPTDASANARCGAGTVTFSATVPDGITIDWYDADTGGSTVTGGYGVPSFAPSIDASTTYYAQARNATGCVSATRLSVGGTVVNTDPPTLTQTTGTVCVGSRIYFYASGGSGTYVWSGKVTGSGATVTSNNTTAGNYKATVYFTVTTNSITCNSSSTSTTGTITAGAATGSAPNECGCAGALCAGATLCRTSCGIPQCGGSVPGCPCLQIYPHTSPDPYGDCMRLCVKYNGYCYYAWRGIADDGQDVYFCVCRN